MLVYSTTNTPEDGPILSNQHCNPDTQQTLGRVFLIWNHLMAQTLPTIRVVDRAQHHASK